jgi:hypothetical protein
MTTKQEIIDTLNLLKSYITVNYSEDKDIDPKYICIQLRDLINAINDYKPKVKPLKWRESQFGLISEDGYYSIIKLNTGSLEYRISHDMQELPNNPHYTLESAMAACQHHYEQDILKALEL